MATLTFYRPKESFNQRFSYDLYLNGISFGSLSNGEERTIEIPKSEHPVSIQAKLMWCGSKKISLSEHTHLSKVKVTGNRFLNHTLPYLGALFPLTGTLLFTELWPNVKPFGLGILLTLLLGLIGTLTLGRNQWITLELEKHR